MSWIELKLKFPQDKLEDISAYLFALGCEGINVTETDIIIYFSTRRWTQEVQKGMVEYLRHFEPKFSRRNIQVANLTEHDWLSDWKKGFRAMPVGEKIIVKPPWEKYRVREGEIVLTINPKMAFGTGHHESTQLMIMETEKTLKPGMDVLDVGTGSGILAILASKMHAQRVLAIDNDPEAIRNAQENARLNLTAGEVFIALGDPAELPAGQYDLILANINRNVLIKYAETFAGFVKPGGCIILSGLLISDELAVLPVYREAGFNLIRRNALKECLGLVLSKEPKKNDEEQSGDRDRTKLNPAVDRALE